MHAVARLIEDVRAANGWNQAEVGRRIGMSRQRVSQFINEPVKAVPTRETIVSLARGLGVPAWVVMDAYLESVGLPTRPTRLSVEEAVAADTALTTADKRAVLAFIEHLHPNRFDLGPVEMVRLAEEPDNHTVQRPAKGC